jgi:hypothetical protein
MNKELKDKINDDCQNQGLKINSDDINNLLIKKGSTIDYGLRITYRKYSRLALFEFNVDKKISFD